MFISDNESFNPSLWEEQRKQRAQVAFECDEDKDEREAPPRVSPEFFFAYLVLPFLLLPPLISAFSLLWLWVSLLNKSNHQFKVSGRMKHYCLDFFVAFAFSLGTIWPNHFQQGTREEFKQIHSNVGPDYNAA